MKKAIEFVKGAIGKENSLIDEYSHLSIDQGFVKATNGLITMCAPIPLNVKCAPKAGALVRALGNCTGADDEVIRISMTPAGRLSLKSGAYKAFIDCLPETNHFGYPEGTRLEGVVTEPLVAGLKALLPIVDKTATKVWSRGVRFGPQCLEATDNVIGVQLWLGFGPAKPVVIPHEAVAELMRIKEIPDWVQVDDRSITFHFSDRRWLKSALLEDSWPNLEAIVAQPGNPTPVPEMLAEYCKKLKPECDKFGSLYIGNDRIGTHPDDDAGSSFELPGAPEARVNVDKMLLVLAMATHIDIGRWPKPILFYGPNLRGGFAGMARVGSGA